MRFLTKEESIKWCNNQGITLSSRSLPEMQKPDVEIVTFPFPNYLKFVALSKVLSKSALQGEECLLWVSDFSVWPSSENLPLYYKLRNSYTDFDLLIQRPGHLFAKHEIEDLTNFLHLGLLFGWDCYLISDLDKTRVFISNDEMIDLCTIDSECLQIIKSQFITNAPAA